MRVVALLAFLLAGAARPPEPMPTSPADVTLTPEWAREWALSVWTTDDGLPQNSVNDLVQGSDGTLWIATFGVWRASTAASSRSSTSGASPRSRTTAS